MEISFTANGEKIIDFDSKNFIKDICKNKNKKFYNFSLFALSFLDLDSITTSKVEFQDTFKWLFGTGVRPLLLMVLCVVALVCTQYHAINGDKEKNKSFNKAKIGKVPTSKITDVLYLIVSIGSLIAWVIL